MEEGIITDGAVHQPGHHEEMSMPVLSLLPLGTIHPCLFLGEPWPAAAGSQPPPASTALQLPDWCGQDQLGHGLGHPYPLPSPGSSTKA